MTQNTTPQGLTDAQVAESRRKHGANILTPPPRPSLIRAFLAKFGDPLIVILIVAGLASIGIATYEYLCTDAGATAFFEPLGIFIAIILATGLAFYFEVKADREFALLNRVNDDIAVQVMRDGRPTSVPRRDIVVGDIVILATGQEIPADGILLSDVSLSVDESTLTGEPVCRKSADPAHANPDDTYPTDLVLRGTKIVEGHGVMRVTAVGDSTENGRVFVAAQIDDGVRTPLDEQLAGLGRLITRAAYIIAAAVIAGRMLMFFVNTPEYGWMDLTTYALQTLMIAVALIAVSVPEGLPMAVTLSLAYSMRRMLRTNNLVRKLHACETMGATTVICTDKTGTLTQNRMQVSEAQFFSNPDRSLVDLSLAANSTALLDLSGDTPSVLGNPTEGALLLWLRDNGTDYDAVRRSVTVLAEVPFSTERKYMATLVRTADNRRILLVKGAPEIVYSLCADTAGIGRDRLDTMLLDYQNHAMRTLGFACRILPDDGTTSIDADGTIQPALTLLGICAIADPVRPDVPDAVARVTAAGIGIKIVTGDTPGTAREIGRRIGLWNDRNDSDDRNLITGPEIDALDDDALRARANDLKIIARARPLDKKRLVRALQQNNHIVAVTGDGTNDAPALKAAHVGLSMGDGTAVAREASDITIIDNSFASIGRAVVWGRSLYLNIQRFIMFQMTVNVVACLTVLIGAFSGMQSPLTVTQMLWVNLIMDTFAAMALASLPPSDSVMNRPPRRRDAFIITQPVRRFIIGAGLAMTAVLLAFLYILNHSDLATDTAGFFTQPLSLSDYHPLNIAQESVFFTVFVFMQFWNMFNARAFDTGRSAFHLRGCRGFLTIAALIIAGQAFIITFGGPFFGVTTLPLGWWLAIALLTSPVLLVGEAARLFGRQGKRR